MILFFILMATYYINSGLQNSSIYAGNKKTLSIKDAMSSLFGSITNKYIEPSERLKFGNVSLWTLANVLILVISWLVFNSIYEMNATKYWLTLIAYFAAGVGNTMVMYNRIIKVGDLHLWEYISLFAYSAGLIAFGADILYVGIAHFFGWYWHKGFINLGSGRSWAYWGTDDESGQTTGLPSLGIKIPRPKRWMHVVAFYFSIVYVLVNELFLNFYIALF